MIKIDEDDLAFLRAQMTGVTSLKKSKVKTFPKKLPVPKLRKKPIESSPEKDFAFSDNIQEVVRTETKLFFARSGIQHKLLRALRAGEIRQTEFLDLHGTTIEEARSILSQFLNYCLQKKQRCVRIIHGKGKVDVHPPVLKNHINSWLQQHPAVLAYCSAKPNEGGAGAMYVLLKNSNKFSV